MTRGTAIAVTNGDAIYLSLRLACQYFNGSWQLPSGGLEFRETIHVGAARELFEETRLIVAPNDLKLIGNFSIPNRPEGPYISSLFLHRLRPGEKLANPESYKHSDWHLVSFDDATTLPLVPGHWWFIELLKRAK